MQNFIKIAFPVAFAAFFSCKGKPSMTPTAYNDSIVAHQTLIARLMIDMANAGDDIQKAQELRQKAAAQAEASIKAIENLGPYQDDRKLLDAALNLFNFYKDICNNEFKELYDLANNTINGDDSTSLKKMMEINERIAEKEKPLDEAFASAQKEFAEKHKVKIEENALQKEIDALGNP